MRHDEIRALLAQSSDQDWHAIACWGHGAGPSYHESSTAGFSAAGGVRSHGLLGVYRPDVLVTVAHGMPISDEGDTRRLDWAVEAFDEDALTFEFADVFYANVLVERVYTVAVDGGRAVLPVPVSGAPGEPPRVEAYRRDVARIVHELEHASSGYESFDSYLERAGIVVVG
jgi:hypothetical protein